MMNDDLKAMQRHCESMAQQIKLLSDEIKRARKTAANAANAWPDFQVRVGAEWYDREKTPPDGYIWASDGIGVWLIHGNGEPIGEHATAVKFWTDAYIPAPPMFIAGD